MFFIRSSSIVVKYKGYNFKVTPNSTNKTNLH